MSVQSNVVIAQELQRELKMCSYGTYQSSRIQPITQPASPTNDGDVSEFELPVRLCNHFLDRLEFDLTAPDVGGAAHHLWTEGLTPIRRLELVSRGGQYVLDLVNPNVFTNMTSRYLYSQDEIKTMPRLKLPGGSVPTYKLDGCYQALMPLFGSAGVTTETLAGGTISPVLTDGVTNKAIKYGGTSIAAAALALTSADSLNEPAVFFSTRALAAAVVLRFRIPMKYLRETYFETSQDVNFNEIMLLRITWGPAARVGRSGANLVGGADIAQYTISNLYYYIAMQKNQSIIDMINSLPEQNIMIKYPVYTKTPTTGGAGASNTITIRYNPPQGRRLLRIYWAPYNTTETGITAYDHDNLWGTTTAGVLSQHKVSSFYTQVDGIRVNQYDYDCIKFEDYHAIKHLLEGSCVTSESIYANNMTFVENFSDNYPLCRKFETDKQNWVEGMPIEKEIKYEITFVGTAINLQNYVYAITQKMLTISRDRGVIVA